MDIMDIMEFLGIMTIVASVYGLIFTISDRREETKRRKQEIKSNHDNTVLDNWIDRLFQDGIVKVERGEFYDYVVTEHYIAKFWNRNSEYHYASNGVITDSVKSVLLKWSSVYPTQNHAKRMQKYVTDYGLLFREKLENN